MSNEVNSTNNALSTKTAFFPEDYVMPDKSKQFMKLTPGDNLIRILSSPQLGYVIFGNDKKPRRKQFSSGDFTKDELEEIKPKKNEDGSVEGSKHFWIMLVWDFQVNIPRILEITQTSILKALYTFSQDEDWGDLRTFNINLKREGTTKNDTKFEVVPKPHKPLEQGVVDEINTLVETGMLDLDAIWKGEYPFENYPY